MKGRVWAILLIGPVGGAFVGGTLAADTLLDTARAQNTREENLALCKGEDVGRKMYGCSALIDSGQETAETLAIAYVNRGNALEGNGQIDLALADYEKALKNNPQSAEALCGRGSALAQKGEYDRAIADLDAALKADPKNVKALASRGYALSKKKEYDRAIEDYTEAIKLGSDGGRIYRLRCSAYREKGQFDLAIQDCDEAINRDPNDAAAFYVRGLSKQKKGDKSGGKADVAKAKLIDPKVEQQ